MRQTLASVQALHGVAEKARTSTPWLNNNPTLREMLDRQLAENNPSTPRSPFDNGAGPNLSSVSTNLTAEISASAILAAKPAKDEWPCIAAC